MALILAAVGAAVICIGVGMVYVPAGVIAGGLQLVAAAYVAAYLKAREAQ